MNVVAMNAAAPLRAFSDRQIALIQNTVAKDCNRDEFNLFVEVARAKGLDPFLGQIIPMVFNKDHRDQTKRKLTIIISRDGQRVIAQRCGDYRPASKPPTYEIDPALVGSANPHGMISATVYLWKQDPRTSEWYEVAGQAFWDEFAPFKYAANQYDRVDTGDKWPDGNPKVDKVLKANAVASLDTSGNWARMPRLMIAKCAEMQALRAGWPAHFDGLYDEAEMDRAKVIDADAAEVAEQFATDQRLAHVNAKGTIPIVLDRVEGKIEFIPEGQFADKVSEWLRDAVSADDVSAFVDRNQNAFKMFWAFNKADALSLRKAIDARSAELGQQIVEG